MCNYKNVVSQFLSYNTRPNVVTESLLIVYSKCRKIIVSVPVVSISFSKNSRIRKKYVALHRDKL